jgi:hypothetical protein
LFFGEGFGLGFQRVAFAFKLFAALPLLRFFPFVFVALLRFFLRVFMCFFSPPFGEQPRFRARSEAFQVVVAFAEPAFTLFGFPGDRLAFLIGGSGFFAGDAGMIVLAELDGQPSYTCCVGAATA